ncbi:MAG: efflux RND transporter periplasmic adaptor subunit [Myxococcota bacterium]
MARKPTFWWLIAAVMGTLAPACVDDDAAHDEALPVVRVQEVELGEVTDKGRFLGRVEPIESVELRARVEGFLEDRSFSEGRMVEEGEPLFVIEQANYRANLKDAEAQLARARAERKEAERSFKRRESLIASDAVSLESVEEAEKRFVAGGADIRSAEAAVARAKLELDYTTIRAPISGRISKARYTKGNLVGPTSEPLAEIVQLDPIRVHYTVTDRQRLAAWSAISPESLEDFEGSFVPRIDLPNGERYEHPGKIDFSASKVDPNTGAISIWASFPNPDALLLPGHLVHVESETRATHPAPVVPAAALQQDRNGTFVYIVNDDDLVERRDVERGEVVEGGVTILAGLDGGERAIVASSRGAVPGTKVEPVSFGEGALSQLVVP